MSSLPQFVRLPKLYSATGTSHKGASPQADCDHRHCPLCSRDNRDREKSRYSRGHWKMKRCVDCGFVYLENVFACEELVERHTWIKNIVAEREFRNQREPVFRLLSRLARTLTRIYGRVTRRNKSWTLIKRYVQNGRVLDVGCGKGILLRVLDDRFTPFGIEISKKAAQNANLYAAERGGSVIQSDALSGLRQLDNWAFDGIVMRAFLEHEQQPQAVLDQAARVLRPGGHLIIMVPNFNSVNRVVRGRRWSAFIYPDHMNHFTPVTLRTMVKRAGLNIVRFRFVDRLPTSDTMWMVAKRTRPSCSIAGARAA